MMISKQVIDLSPTVPPQRGSLISSFSATPENLPETPDLHRTASDTHMPTELRRASTTEDIKRRGRSKEPAATRRASTDGPRQRARSIDAAQSTATRVAKRKEAAIEAKASRRKSHSEADDTPMTLRMSLAAKRVSLSDADFDKMPLCPSTPHRVRTAGALPNEAPKRPPRSPTKASTQTQEQPHRTIRRTRSRDRSKEPATTRRASTDGPRQRACSIDASRLAEAKASRRKSHSELDDTPMTLAAKRVSLSDAVVDEMPLSPSTPHRARSAGALPNEAPKRPPRLPMISPTRSTQTQEQPHRAIRRTRSRDRSKEPATTRRASTDGQRQRARSIDAAQRTATRLAKRKEAASEAKAFRRKSHSEADDTPMTPRMLQEILRSARALSKMKDDSKLGPTSPQSQQLPERRRRGRSSSFRVTSEAAPMTPSRIRRSSSGSVGALSAGSRQRATEMLYSAKLRADFLKLGEFSPLQSADGAPSTPCKKSKLAARQMREQFKQSRSQQFKGSRGTLRNEIRHEIGVASPAPSSTGKGKMTASQKMKQCEQNRQPIASKIKVGDDNSSKSTLPPAFRALYSAPPKTPTSQNNRRMEWADHHGGRLDLSMIAPLSKMP
jgi:hypothetical protein